MTRKIYGVTVGTTMSPEKVAEKLNVNGIVSITPYYAFSSDTSVVPTKFGTDIPLINSLTKCLWGYTEIEYTDGTKQETAPRLLAVHGSDASVTEANIKSALGYTPANQMIVNNINKSITDHKTDETAHNDIRLLIQGLDTRLTALSNSDDITLDQMAEVVAYIKSNRTLIESVTTGKVSVTDIVNNLTTNVANKPLSAAQGVALKGLIDTLQTAVNAAAKASDLNSHTGNTTAHITAAERSKWNQAVTDVGQVKEEIADQQAQIDKLSQVEAPTIVSSVDEMTDPSKKYSLNGTIWQYGVKTEEIVIPGETITVPGKAVIIKGQRYSHSGGSFSASDNSASVIFPIETEYISQANAVPFILTNMLGHATYTGIYHGETTESFPGETAARVASGNFTNFTSYGLPSGKWFAIFFIQYTGTETFENASFVYGDLTFRVGENMEVYSNASDRSKATHPYTTTTEGRTETITTEGFYNTGQPYFDDEYGERIAELETIVEEHEGRIAKVEAISKYKSKRVVIDSSMQTLTSSVSMTVPQLKKNKTLAFSGIFTGNLTEISIVQGEGTGFTEAKCVVNATSVTIIKNGSTVYTAEHGLTFGSYFSIVLATKNANKTKAYLSSGGKTFASAEFVWNSSRSGLKLYTNVPFTQYKFSFGSNDFDKKLWMYGDSYFDHWLPISISRGYTNCLADGYSGGGSSAGATSFQKAIEHGTPSKVVWCLGMNDGDSGAVNQSWLNAITTIKQICDELEIELWVTTIPNVPSKNHTYKNAYIRQNFNYIDLAKYVGADEGTTWYTGLLSSDNVHPTTEGDFYIANIMENYLPEMLEA